MTYNVLIVDDEEGIRMAIKRVLNNYRIDFPFLDEPIEIDVYEAESAELAIEVLKDTHIDIILLDNKLPGMQGLDIMPYINEHYPDIRILIITSFASLDIALEATKHGAFDFIPKPFTPGELKNAIETVTKQIYLNNILKDMDREARKIRFKFLSILSHELKTPINTLEGYMMMIKEKELGPNVDNYMDLIDKMLNKLDDMRALIMDLLDFTNLNSDQTIGEKEFLSLKNIINFCVDSQRPLAIQKSISFDIDIKSSLNFFASKNEMEILFNNLINNAIKYNKNGGKVIIKGEETDNSIIIKIKDTGIGIPESDLSKIFDEFYRSAEAKSRRLSGTGLGLSIVKRMIELYNGSIDVESKLNEFTEFTIILPKNNNTDKAIN
jgi:signal transduction histidine kinase